MTNQTTLSQDKRILKSDDHSAWRTMCGLLERGWTFEGIANELRCDVDHLIDWANHTYTFPKKETKLAGLPVGSPAYNRILAAERTRTAAQRQLRSVTA